VTVEREDHLTPEVDGYYPGCAMPVGMKADFWRQYFFVNLRERIQRRSILDEVLQELERSEERELRLRPILARYVVFVETCSMDLEEVRRIYEAAKIELGLLTPIEASDPYEEGGA